MLAAQDGGAHGDRDSEAYKQACAHVAGQLLRGAGLSRRQISALIRETSSAFHLSSLPRHEDILALMPADRQGREGRRELLVKPVKSASGVTVIAVMPKPYSCPHGRCIYCPGGIEHNTPLSYTGTEPATRTAQEHDYDAFEQVSAKLCQLRLRGHETAKCELVFVGGTFPFFPEEYQRGFAKSCYDALNGVGSASLDQAKMLNETSENRCVGLTVETKPDYCKQSHVDLMLELGATRIELGVQSLQEQVYRIVNRGHTLQDVYEAFSAARDSGFKIVAHMMPGLPGSSPEKDIADFGSLLRDERLRPDMLKIYPTLVLEGTGLFRMHSEGRYSAYSQEDVIRVIAEAKKIIPPWVRIMRVQREIESSDIVAGPRQGNLRQIVLERLKSEGISCRCIRCREAGLQRRFPEASDVRLYREDYDAAAGREVFLSFENRDRSVILGFLRLRLVSPQAARPELEGSAVIRELHVYGQAISLGSLSGESMQHRGYGARLMAEAEQVARSEFGAAKISVISAVGTREYYRRLGYERDGPYMSKRIS
ncbi:MAG: tRNA uridine(34) 5-carboxymethylaminomethyl modification radical SAM/GNAT enzyme Elp3 [Nitrososphaera sp.]